MHRKLIIGGAVAAAIAVWLVVWYVIAGVIEREANTWIARQRAQGVRIEFSSLTVGGFPFGWHIDVGQPTVVAPGPAAPEWKGDRATATIRPWNPRSVWMRFEGSHRLTYGEGNARQAAVLEAARPDAILVVNGEGALESLTVDFGSLTIRSEAIPGPVTAARAQGVITVAPRRPPTERARWITVTLDWLDVALPPPLTRGMPNLIQRLELEGGFNGALTPGPAAAAVRAWREAGGTIEINRLALNWAPLDIEGDATIALDEQDRPLFAGVARARGLIETIDRAQQARLIPGTQAFAARFAVMAQQRPGPDGRPQVVVPFNAQDGVLTVMNLQVLRLPPLRFQ